MPRLPQESLGERSGPYGPLLSVLHSRPEIGSTLVRHAQELVASGTVPRRAKELCALMASWLNACEYCTSCHTDLADRLGIDQATLDDLGNYARSEHFNPSERAVLAATVSLTREPRGLPDRLWEDLRAHFDEGQCVEVMATIGFYNYINRLSNALQIGPMLE